jgi:hypothetical protein
MQWKSQVRLNDIVLQVKQDMITAQFELVLLPGRTSAMKRPTDICVSNLWSLPISTQLITTEEER